MKHARVLALAITAAAIATTGCGSSAKVNTAESTSTRTEAAVPTSPALTRTAMIARADVICKGVVRKLKPNAAQTEDQIASVGAKLVPYEQTAVAGLRGLTPPSSMAEDWRQILTGAEILTTDTVKLTEYARTKQLGTTAARTMISTSARTRARALAIAKRDGFTYCAQAL